MCFKKIIFAKNIIIMKIKAFLTIVIFLIAGINTLVNAQKGKSFEGTITYDITYPGSTMDAGGQLPTSVIITIKGDKQRMEQLGGMATITAITDSKLKSQLILIDAMGNKMAYRVAAKETDSALATTTPAKVKILDETKDIAGYKCKKAEVTIDDNTAIYYFTEDMGIDNPNWSSPFREIKGMLMEYEQSQNGLKMKFTAKTVKAEKIKDTKFMMPTDYKELTKEELKQMMGGGE